MNETDPDPNLLSLFRRLDHEDSTVNDEQRLQILDLLLALPAADRTFMLISILDRLDNGR